jgi:hypothetical protein
MFSDSARARFSVMADWPASFKEAYCERYRCSPEQFVHCAFKHGLYRRARFIAPAVMLFSRRLFQLDIDLIHEIGATRSWGDFNSVISNHVQSSHLRSGFFRNVLKLRVSCSRLKRIAMKLFGRRGD